MTEDPLLRALRDAGVTGVTPDAPLSDLTTLKVGGPTRVLVEADSDDDLAAVGRVCAEFGAPWLVVGRGSNLLVADAGWPGVTITLGRGFRGHETDGEIVRAGAAEPLPSLAARVGAAGFVGFAWAAAVPGSLGGAVRMNAGAHGGEMAHHLESADLLRLTSGTRETWPVATLGLSYRRSELPSDAIVVAAVLRLGRGDAERVRAEIAEIRAWRRAHQPIREPNCGSVFTNPPGDSAGRLIEAVGAKGLAIGGARISDVHANFVVTCPGATASDVRALVREVRQRVAEEHGIVLRPEVQMIGDFADDGLDVSASGGG